MFVNHKKLQFLQEAIVYSHKYSLLGTTTKSKRNTFHVIVIIKSEAWRLSNFIKDDWLFFLIYLSFVTLSTSKVCYTSQNNNLKKNIQIFVYCTVFIMTTNQPQEQWDNGHYNLECLHEGCTSRQCEHLGRHLETCPLNKQSNLTEALSWC